MNKSDSVKIGRRFVKKCEDARISGYSRQME